MLACLRGGLLRRWYSPTSSPAFATTVTTTTTATATRNRATFVRIARKHRMELFLAKTYGYASRLCVVSPPVAAEFCSERNPKHVFPQILSAGDLRPYWWVCNQ